MKRIIKITVSLSLIALLSACYHPALEPSMHSQCINIKHQVAKMQFQQRAHVKYISPAKIDDLQGEYQSLNCQYVTGKLDYADVN